VQVRLKEHHRIAVGGVSRWHQAGEVLDLPEDLAQSLIATGVAGDPDTPLELKDPKCTDVVHTKKREFRRK